MKKLVLYLNFKFITLHLKIFFTEINKNTFNIKTEYRLRGIIWTILNMLLWMH